MPKTQDMPAFFLETENGERELINTHLKGDYVVVQRLVDKVVLVLGKSEVSVSRGKRGFAGLFGR